MNKQDKKCGLSQESHQWVGDTCTDCGIAWSAWVNYTIKELVRRLDEAPAPESVPSPSRRTPAEEEIIEELYRRKREYEPTEAYVTITQPVTLQKWNLRHHPSVEANMTSVEVPAGTTLKIVMVSRFGDCGLTDDLNATYGYHVRIDLQSAILSNIRWNP